jgi:DNA-binding transcriptional regulator YhcF (GntR family)
MFISINMQKVANEIFENPTKEQSIREISKKVGLVPATTSKIIKELAKKGIIKIKRVAKSMLVSADLESSSYKFYKRVYNILSIKNLIDGIKVNNPLCIVLFGSYSKGEDIESSDVDLAVIGRHFEIETSGYEKQINRKIHLLFFKDEKAIPSDLRRNINNGIVFSGGLL